MLINAFASDWLEQLDKRISMVPPGFHTYLLLDGACIPRLHEGFANERKAILFASLPACSQSVRDVSPFLTPYDPDDRRLKMLLKRCSGWPMVSAIVTSESLGELAARLAAWCIVETGDQRFNFRFPDTRRLPAICQTLHLVQRQQLAGPATSWTYIARHGGWCALDIAASNATPAAAPSLDSQQFSALVDDGMADEFMTVLRHRGHDPFAHTCRSYALVSAAIRVAQRAALEDEDLIDWCEWYWKHDKKIDDQTAVSLLAAWQKKE
jgi:hypothetical protein